jgi:hypothetical protein
VIPQKRNRDVLNALMRNPHPKWLRGNAYKIIEYFLVNSDEEGFCGDSYETIAYACGFSKNTVRRQLDNLKNNIKVLVVRSGKQYYTANVGAVQIDVLMNSLGVPKPRSQPGDDAYLLTQHYYARVKGVLIKPRNGHNSYRARVRKGWEQEWSNTIQNWLDEGKTQEEIDLVVRRAFFVMPKRASKGPKVLKDIFDRLLAEAKATPTPPKQERQDMPGEHLSKKEVRDVLRRAGDNAGDAAKGLSPTRDTLPAH